MIFTVTYRDKSGALQEIRVDAESRSACASELKHRGIVAVAIQEGKKVSGAAKHKAKAPHNSFGVSRSAKVALFILTFLLAACGIWWWMRSNPVDNKGFPHKKHEKAKTPTKTPKPIVPNVPQGIEAPVGSPPLAEETNKLQGVKVPNVPPAITNYMVGITITTNKPKNIFRSATEKMLYSLFSTPLGNPPPPMGRIPLRDKKELESILQNAFDQGSDKDEKRREMEQTVDAARKVFKDYIAQGGKPDEFMEYFRDELAKYHEHWKMSQKLAVAACRDEDPEVARQMVDEINARLAEKGIKPVNIPPKFRERIGLETVGKEGEAHK